MKISGSLWLTVMRLELIVGYGKLLLRSGRICSSYYSVIKLSFMSSKNYSCSISAFYMSCSCLLMRWVYLWVLYVGLIWSYGYSKRTDFTFGQGREILAWGGPVLLDVSLFLLNSFGHDPCLWLFLISCSMGEFLCIYIGPPKGKFSSVTSCCIKYSLTPFFLSRHPIHSSFGYRIDEVLGIWKDLCWYCWQVFMCWYCWQVFLCYYCWLFFLCWCCWMVLLWVFWRWFGPFWCCNILPKFLLTMGSII